MASCTNKVCAWILNHRNTAMGYFIFIWRLPHIILAWAINQLHLPWTKKTGRPRCYAKSPNCVGPVLANTKPDQLHLGDRGKEKETAYCLLLPKNHVGQWLYWPWNHPGSIYFIHKSIFDTPQGLYCVATVVHGDTQFLWQLWTWVSLVWPLTSVLLYLSGPCLRCHEESWRCHWFKGTQVIPVGLDLCNVTKPPIILRWVHHTQSFKEKTFLEPVC